MKTILVRKTHTTAIAALQTRVSNLSVLEARIAKKDISALKTKVAELLNAVPKNKKAPELDAVQQET